MTPSFKSLARAALSLAVTAALPALASAQEKLSEIKIDWATYNPVSIALKNQGLLEKEFEKDGIKITWVQSLGSNKALEFLNASSLEFGSTAGAAALVGKINGNPIKSIYVYSRPEWATLVTRPDTGIKTVADLKGKRVAATRGTDPHIFLIRALQEAGLSEKDITLVLLQHGDGKAALLRGDVDAWAGLDPLTASAEIENGAILFHRNKEANSWGVLNVREAFAKQHADVVKRVLAAYEQAREWSIAHPEDLKKQLVEVTKLPDAVIERQLKERTDLSHSKIGQQQKDTILAAGLALQKAGVIKEDVNIQAVVDQLIDGTFTTAAK
ncbi:MULTISPECIES: aliphatic sulfonate ABC transporter substrate-binding protein [Hyphomicrobium]|jgi:sulfonate transport system substrate-binding protein|uniref:aliphatic sulfonate ABC transporter substrate-binding protein n=1 Tax=Hyphomicrobium TaxID=81 RepID=UPI0003715385|nr:MULTISPECIES: aliphatic sulfonate ABC transporter substrate-binding protein [Hyphomicrobium]WBT38783.1 aliphatic sulfonate ABC transporter substrate-binding protein [Hyphomicrobium sp. DMF-1]HML42936.1 aliphatic sulfonate ABC transporter substrate-binding protein [Hyphomicrobium zavarzinii]